MRYLPARPLADGIRNTWIDWSRFRQPFRWSALHRSETTTKLRDVSQHSPSSVQYFGLPFLVLGKSKILPGPAIVQSRNLKVPIQSREVCCEMTAILAPRSETAE